MHNIITKAAAKKLFEKIESSNAPIAVFCLNGSWRATKITTDLYKTALKKTPNRLMGVYDNSVRIEWLEDDLAYMGVK